MYSWEAVGGVLVIWIVSVTEAPGPVALLAVRVMGKVPAAGGVPVSDAELRFCAVWVPFFYATIAATAYDTFRNHAGYDVATGAPTIVHLPQLMEFLSSALHTADGASTG